MGPGMRICWCDACTRNVPASVTNITLTGAMDDVHGRTVAVSQDHDGVRIDVGPIEIMLDRAAVAKLLQLLETARDDAADWEMDLTRDA